MVTQVLSCIHNLTDFQLIVKYFSYTKFIIGYIKGYLKSYYNSKATFKKYKATKRDKHDMTDAVYSLQQDYKRVTPTLESETNAVKAKYLEENYKELIAKKNKLVSSFNFIKMYLSTHYKDYVRCFRSIPTFSTKAGEFAHC